MAMDTIADAEEREAPKGYHREWKPDHSWATGISGYRTCRSPRCGKDAVAALNRGRRTPSGKQVDSWWHYCENHLYGRRIIDGEVMSHVLVENEDNE